ncbi:hypothetical protein AAG906_004805 [Vitis piasezkii]
MKHTCIPPECQGHNSLGKKCEAKINDMTMFSLNSSLLLMGVRTKLIGSISRQCLDMLYEFKVVNLLYRWMLMALMLTMLPRRIPSTLVITEAMAITVDDLIVCKVEEEDKISPRTN